MQLNHDNGTRNSSAGVCAMLSAATCTLLIATPVAADGGADHPWRIDVGAMHYAEDDRIKVNEGTVRLRRQLDEDSGFSVRASYDAVSGSSPTGAAKIQSRSGASGTAYLAKFDAKRTAVGGDWDTALGETTRLTLTGDHSTQSAYDSTGVGATVARDINQRNTTLVAGLGYSFDAIKPQTGIFHGLASTAGSQVWQKDDEKGQFDAQVGLTQVIARGTLAQLNYVHSRAVGYMSNPYKIISVVNAATGTTGDYDAVYEKRPRVRDMNALYAQLNQSVGQGVAYLAYRYFWDDWGIRAHTFDVKFRQPLGERLFVQPHVRYYRQGAADFYRSMLTNTEVSNLPQYASADYRLAKLSTKSVGIKLGYRPSGGGEVSARIEVMRQNGEEQPWDAVGVQREAGVFPDLKAMMVNIAYTVPF